MRDRLLRSWARFVIRNARLVLLVLLVITVAAVALIPGLRIEAGHSKLEDKNNPHQRRFTEFLNTFGSPNLLIALVEGGDEALRRKLVDRLAAALPAATAEANGSCKPDAAPNAPGCVRDVLGRIDMRKMESHALLYLPVDGVRTLVDTLKGDGFGLKTLLEADGLAALLEALTEELERRGGLAPPKGDEMEAAEQAMDRVGDVFEELAQRVRDPKRAELPLQDALLGNEVQSGIDSRGYLSSNDGEIKLVMVRPVDDSDEPLVVVPFVGYVQAIGASAAQELGRQCSEPEACPDGELRLTLTGLPAIVADETDVLKHDITLTTVVAILGILLLFYFGFRSFPQTLVGLLPLLTGLAWTLAYVRLGYESLNLITSAFIVTLLGLGIDFAVHLMSRFNEARAGGQSPEEAAEAAIMGAGPGILTGALTTSGAFVALAASRFLGFSQLGIITGVGLTFVLLVTFTMMPAMLVHPSFAFLRGKVRPLRKPGEPGAGFDLPGMVVRRRGAFVTGGVVLAVLMILAAQSIPWSYDYMKLMPRGLASVEAMATLSSRTDFSAETAALIADSPEQARAYSTALKAKRTVARAESLVDFLPQNQEKKRTILAELRPLLAGRSPVEAEPASPPAIQEALQDLIDGLEDARFTAVQGGAEAEARLLARPIAGTSALMAALKDTPREVLPARIGAVQKQIMDGIEQGLSILEQNVEAEPVTLQSLVQSLPTGLRDRLYSDGKLAVYAYPAAPIWDKAYMGQLIDDLRDVDEEATGFPVTHWETSQSIELGFRDASVIACIALVILLLVDFRSLRYTLFALAPLAMGIAWMWGGMSLLSEEYNYVTVIAFPLIIGIGVASGVHILHRYRQEGERDVAPVVRFTGMAIFLSAATTMVGFGSLALATHQGAASLGKLLLLGVGACLATAVVFLPALLQLLRR